MAAESLDRRAFEPVLRPPCQAESLPPRCYTGQEFLELEGSRVFRSAWASLGRADRLAGPGDYAALDMAGVPLLLLRESSFRPLLESLD